MPTFPKASYLSLHLIIRCGKSIIKHEVWTCAYFFACSKKYQEMPWYCIPDRKAFSGEKALAKMRHYCYRQSVVLGHFTK